jgi:Ala-tRNA(Pro) deacylase
MTDARTAVLAALQSLGITYELYEHPAVFTSEQAAVHWEAIPGVPVKNLFLRNKKGDRHYLVVLGIDKTVDLRHLASVIGDDRLSFASPERLSRYLGVAAGSVSPLGLIHDTTRAVAVVLDSALREADRLILHPNDNTASLALSSEDVARFLAHQGNAVRWVRI